MPRNRPSDEETPLLDDHDAIEVDYDNLEGDQHKQFCLLIGIPPSDLPPNQKQPPSSAKKLYQRAKRKQHSQSLTYKFTASLSNALLLSQVVLGATLTALGASESSHVLITLFGVLNTVIAGLVAYLKSRGQPMRARMFLDDLEHVVAEIENSEIMWLGISRGVHGYDEIDVDDQVSVRSEVARLTRLYDKAVRSNTQNNPDMYMAGAGGEAMASLRARPPGGQLPEVPGNATMLAAMPQSGPAVPAAGPSQDEEESPATKKKDSKPPDIAKDIKDDSDSVTPPSKDRTAASTSGAPASPPPAANAATKADPDDEGPASAKEPPKADSKDTPNGDADKDANASEGTSK